MACYIYFYCGPATNKNYLKNSESQPKQCIGFCFFYQNRCFFISFFFGQLGQYGKNSRSSCRSCEGLPPFIEMTIVSDSNANCNREHCISDIKYSTPKQMIDRKMSLLKFFKLHLNAAKSSIYY